MNEREWWKNWLKENKKYRKMLPLLFIPGGIIVAGIWFFVWGIRESDRDASGGADPRSASRSLKDWQAWRDSNPRPTD